MEKLEVLPERVGKKEKSLKALAPMVRRSVIVNQDPIEFPLHLSLLKMEL